MPLSEKVGHRVLVKFEGAQHTGAFKFRGAYNRLSRLSSQERAAGVVAWSSGNHAQGVAAAARLLGIQATIVMPADAPAVKLANTRALGAQIITYDRHTQSREEIATALADERGAVLVPSFDDPSSSPDRARSDWKSWNRQARSVPPSGGFWHVAAAAGWSAGSPRRSRTPPSHRHL
jgi:threonine dehydratase